MRDRVRRPPGQEQSVAERGLSGEKRRVERGSDLQMRDGFLGLIEIEKACAAQELQIARAGFVLDELGEERESARKVAAAEERPRQTRLRFDVIRRELQRLPP